MVIQAFCPAQTSVYFDRKVARNPLLLLHSTVRQHLKLQKTMIIDIPAYKEQFLIDEYLASSINAGLQTRNKLYPIYLSSNSNTVDSQPLRSEIKDFLKSYIERFNNLTEDEHFNCIELLSNKLSENHKNFLFKKRFRIGISQKIINLFLKYMWSIDKVKTPFHCPFDNIIKNELMSHYNDIVLVNWTELDSMEKYIEYVNVAKKVADKNGLKIAEWELLNWKKQ